MELWEEDVVLEGEEVEETDDNKLLEDDVDVCTLETEDVGVELLEDELVLVVEDVDFELLVDR